MVYHYLGTWAVKQICIKWRAFNFSSLPNVIPARFYSGPNEIPITIPVKLPLQFHCVPNAISHDLKSIWIYPAADDMH